MPFADPQEKAIAEKVLAAVRSDRFKSKNYLFQQPFALDDVPGYLEEVGKPLDLQTIDNNLKNGVYDDNPQSNFWQDLQAVFQNAIAYHSKRETKWISKIAKDMLKIVAKERKKAENPGASAAEKKPTAAAKLKLKLKPSPESTMAAPLAAPSSAAASVAPPDAVQTKKPKLKLKLSTKSTGSSSKSAAAAAPAAKPLPPASSSSTAPSEKAVAKKAKPTQPKLKLKLSLNKKKSEQDAKATKEITGAAPPKPSKSAPPEGAAAAAAASVVKVGAPAGARGKELPQGVAAPTPKAAAAAAAAKATKGAKASTKAAPKTKKPKKAKATTPKYAATGKASAPAPAPTSIKSPSAASAAASAAGASASAKQSGSGGAGGARLDAQQKKQCAKVLMGIKRRKQKQVAWFLNPVSDKAILPDYRAKIQHPMDLSTIQSKLEKGSYRKLDAFVLDVRRVVANALRYNTSIKDSLRPLAIEVLQAAETLMEVFLARFYPQSYQPLLYCWKICIDILNTLYNLTNPNDGHPMALYFLHPVSYYCGGQFPPDYPEKVNKPMDFGTITANLIEGRYQSADAFASDCRLVIQNCQTYYQGRDDGRTFVDQALRLQECLSTSLAQLARYDKSTGASERQKKAEIHQHPALILQQKVLPNQPPPALLQSVVDELRTLKYTDKGTKITEPAMGPFEKPVSLLTFPDYAQHVSEPMDLQTVERKIKAGTVYETPEDFEYDMTLIFKNCEIYNAKRNAQHPVFMAKFAVRKFRTIFYGKMAAFEDPAASPPKQPDRAPSSSVQPDNGAQPPPNKKLKIDASSVAGGAAAGGGKGKSAPRISIKAAQISSAASAAQRIKPPPLPKSSSNISKSGSQPSTAKPKPQAPVPLHVAITKVKEAFPLRRQAKTLQAWEADCAKYFKELMRHPWVSTTKPKFIFHVPVPILFPDLQEVYGSKIRKPMDLTTIECTLLAGNRYTGPEDFLQDVALCFTNAIRFNKDGRDLGDPLSCAYYDASVHLLNYSRWLSLEWLSNHIAPASEHIKDESSPDGLPPFQWRLTEGNRRIARQEQESIVLKESIEKSHERDRSYTWMESECEKLCKALKLQSDAKRMAFFMHPNYPADYTAFIPRPMDLEKVQRTLKKRHYETFGEIIDDLRLIFTNAEKYNSRYKGTDSVSGQAYEAARIMSLKLEAAINKMLLAVSDRLERERIDHANAEREIEAAERAEEAQIRATWKKQGDAESSSAAPTQAGRGEVSQKTRIVRRLSQRRATDFEIPFFDDEDDGHHEQSHFELIKYQKERFEKQRQELTKMREKSSAIGASVLTRLFQRKKTNGISGQSLTNSAVNKSAGETASKASDEKAVADRLLDQASAVLGELEKEGRKPMQISLAVQKPKKKSAKGKRGFQGF